MASIDDRDRLRMAFESHYLSLLRLGTLLTGNLDSAEDLVQDAFVRLGPRLAGMSTEEAGRYLRVSVLNLWKNRLRRASVERRLGLGRPSEAPSPESVAADRDVVWRALTVVPAKQRMCLVLRYYEDLPERDIARMLRCSVGAVKSNLSRGLERMRRELSHGSGG